LRSSRSNTIAPTSEPIAIVTATVQRDVVRRRNAIEIAAMTPMLAWRSVNWNTSSTLTRLRVRGFVGSRVRRFAEFSPNREPGTRNR